MSQKSAVLLFVFILGGCRAIPWPEMEPQVYTGTVINAANGQPVPGAEVEAWRPKFRWQPPAIIRIIERESIGTAIAGEDGRFELETAGGYATGLRSSSGGRFPMHGGAEPTTYQSEEVSIELRHYLSAGLAHALVDHEDVPPEGAELADGLGTWIAGHPDDPFRSLSEYASLGVIGTEVVKVIAANPHLFFAPYSGVDLSWHPNRLEISGVDDPIHLVVGSSSWRASWRSLQLPLDADPEHSHAKIVRTEIIREGLTVSSRRAISSRTWIRRRDRFPVVQALAEWAERNPEQGMLSLRQYVDSGFIEWLDFEDFCRNPRLYFEPHPGITFRLGNREFRFDGVDVPIRLVPIVE